MLPLQSTRGPNRTVIGAVGGLGNIVDCIFSIERKTCKETVRQFIEKLLHESRFRTNRMVLVMDNASSHHALYVTDYLAYRGLEVIFLPPYSSPLNSCERVWSLLKKVWSKAISTLTVNYDMANLETDINIVMSEVAWNLTPKILHANQKYIDLVEQGTLV